MAFLFRIDKFGRLYRTFGIQHAAFLCRSSYEQLVFAFAQLGFLRNQPSLFILCHASTEFKWKLALSSFHQGEKEDDKFDSYLSLSIISRFTL